MAEDTTSFRPGTSTEKLWDTSDNIFFKGKQFGSYQDLQNALEKYSRVHFCKFWTRSSRTIKAVKRLLKADLVYYELCYACIHGGVKFKTTGTGKRNCKTYRMDCPFLIKLIASKDGQSLEVKNFIERHENHPAESKTLYQHLHQEQILDVNVKDEPEQLLQLGANKKLVRKRLQSKTSKTILLKDLRTVSSAAISKRNHAELGLEKCVGLLKRTHASTTLTMSVIPKPLRDVGGILVEPASVLTGLPTWCSGYTDRADLEVYKFVVVWAPRATQCASKKRPPIFSPPFPLAQQSVQATLALYPDGATSSGWSSIYMTVDKKHEDDVKAHLKVWYTTTDILGHNKVEWKHYSKNDEISTTKETMKPDLGWGFPYVWKSSDIPDVNTVYVKMEIEVLMVQPIRPPSPHSKVLAEVESLGLADAPTDVVFKVGDSEFKAHKAVLQRSPVFKAMLESDAAEAKTGVINLEGISVAAATALLDFFYGREFSLWRAVEPAVELLEAAAMYELPELRAMCEDALQSSLSVSSVARILEAACIYESPQLKEAALEFLNRNKVAVTSTPEWKVVAKRSPLTLFNAVLRV